MSASLRARYVTDAVQTTSPQRLVTMLYDRLVLDLNKGEAGMLPGGDTEAGRAALGHALDILTELRASLDLSVWEGAAGLARLYAFLMTELIGADLNSDAGRVASCRLLVEPLRDAWHEAASLAAAESSGRVVTAAGTDVTAVWAAVLTAYAARLDDVAVALDAGNPDVVQPFPVPEGLPPLPDAHRRWAEDLLRQSLALEQLMTARLALMSPTEGGHEATPTFIDALA